MIRQRITQSANCQRTGQESNEGMGGRINVRMGDSTCLSTNPLIKKERMARSTAHLLRRPPNPPTNGPKNEEVNMGPYNTTKRNTIQRNNTKYNIIIC